MVVQKAELALAPNNDLIERLQQGSYNDGSVLPVIG